MLARQKLLHGLALAVAVLVIAVIGIMVWQPWVPDVEPALVEKMAQPLPDKPTIALTPAQPNILVIMLDDLGKEGLARFGNAIYHTPNIDRLADEGMRFTRFYTSTMCSPTRATLLTGLYANRHGITRVNDVQARGGCLDPAFGSFAQAVKSVGYTTAVSGKWHVCPPENVNHPGIMGFDRWMIAGKPYWGAEINLVPRQRLLDRLS